jgi:hypothetical protein
MNEPTTRTLTVRIHTDLWARLDALAQREHRSLNNTMNVLLSEGLDRWEKSDDHTVPRTAVDPAPGSAQQR